MMNGQWPPCRLPPSNGYLENPLPLGIPDRPQRSRENASDGAVDYILYILQAKMNAATESTHSSPSHIRKVTGRKIRENAALITIKYS